MRIDTREYDRRSWRCRCAAAGHRLLPPDSSTQPRQRRSRADAPNVTFTSNSNLVIVDVTVKDPKTGAAHRGPEGRGFHACSKTASRRRSPRSNSRSWPSIRNRPQPPPSLDDQRALPEDPKTTITLPSHNQIQYHDKRLLVLFFDFSNMGIPEQLRAQDAALNYIDTQMTESDLMAILLYTTAVQVKTDFTADRDQLTDIIKAFPIGEMSEMADAADTGDDNGEDTGAAFVADETEFNIFNTDQKLAAIEDAVAQAGRAARKESAGLHHQRHQQDRHR